MESPCRQICRLDEDRGFCTGCGRTPDELRAWTRATEAQQAAIVAAAAARLETLPPRAPARHAAG